MIGTNDAAPKFNADLRLVGSHFLSLLHMLATLRRKHSRLHRAPIFVVIFIQGSSAYLVVRGWWLPTGTQKPLWVFPENGIPSRERRNLSGYAFERSGRPRPGMEFPAAGMGLGTSSQTDSTPEASERPGSGRIEFSSKSTTF